MYIDNVHDDNDVLGQEHGGKGGGRSWGGWQHHGGERPGGGGGRGPGCPVTSSLIGREKYVDQSESLLQEAAVQAVQ